MLPAQETDGNHPHEQGKTARLGRCAIRPIAYCQTRQHTDVPTLQMGISLLRGNCDVCVMTLRPAHRSDASSIAAISIEVWLGTYLRRGVNAFFADFVLQEFTPQKIETLISDPTQWIMVSENTDGIDGFIRVSDHSKAPVSGCSDIEISTFYVQPRHHGTGIGKRLLHAAFDHARAKQAQNIWLATNAENAPAIAFYLAQGFDHVGETHFRIQNDAYLNNVYAYHLG